jgi:molybdopterin-guanine dinucleotide biosynthesis protein A
MPFLSPTLLLRLAEVADAGGVVVPASEGPRGFEPLCASYGASTGDAIRRSLEAGERAIVSFLDDVQVRILDYEEVRVHGDPATMFLNVNRPEDRERAERLAAPRPENATESMDSHHEAT